MPILGHVLKHVPRPMLRHVPVRQLLEHLSNHVPDRHVPDHVFARNVLGLKKMARLFFNAKFFCYFFRTACTIR